MCSKIALIAGTHPMADAVAIQYARKGFSVVRSDDGAYSGESPDEIFIATRPLYAENVREDMKNLGIVRRLCENNKGRHPVKCHLLLHSSQVLRLFHDDSFAADLRGKADIYPFTLESEWAQRIFTLLPGQKSDFSFTDRIPQTVESEKTVHIVLMGLGEMTETLAEHAALTCHYSNYTRNHSLRTRITVVDEDMGNQMHGFIHRHKPLFDNCFYRFVDLKLSRGVSVRDFHRPDYDGIREDWVDVEWEFVNGGIWSEVLRSKLAAWAADESQFLSVIFAHESDDRNIAGALEIASLRASNDFPVLVKVASEEVIEMSYELKGFKPFGMQDLEYDIDQPLVSMAAMVNYVYECCYEDNYLKAAGSKEVFSPVEIDTAAAGKSWQQLPYSRRMANICNAMTIPVKMRSLGYEMKDWNTFYAITAKETALLAEMEHNRWNVATLMLGFRPVTASEEKEIEADVTLKKEYRNKHVHYDLRSYKDLRADVTGRNVNTYDICLAAAIPLISKTYMTEVYDGRK